MGYRRKNAVSHVRGTRESANLDFLPIEIWIGGRAP